MHRNVAGHAHACIIKKLFHLMSHLYLLSWMLKKLKVNFNNVTKSTGAQDQKLIYDNVEEHSQAWLKNYFMRCSI